MSRTLVLFDLPSRHKADGTLSCFSWNTWRTRMLLNYKRVPYRTEWVEYPDLQQRLHALGVAPNSPGSWAPYTCPTIVFPDGHVVMDSDAIAHALECFYPEPSIDLDPEITRRAHSAFVGVAGALYVSLAPSFITNVLDKRGATWFAADRERRFGMALDEAVAANSGEPMWTALEANPDGPLRQLQYLLAEQYDAQGPFILGEKLCYGDFIIASLFESLQRVDLGCYRQLMAFDGSFGELHSACRDWLRDD